MTVLYGLKALYCTTLCGAIRGFQPFFVLKRVGVPLTSRGCSCLSCTNKADGIGLESLTSRGGGVKTLLFLKNHKALTFTSQGFAMSKICCNFRP